MEQTTTSTDTGTASTPAAAPAPSGLFALGATTTAAAPAAAPETTSATTGEPAKSASQAFSFYGEGGKLRDELAALTGDKFKGASSFFAKYAKAEDPTAAALQGLENLQFMASQKGFSRPPDDAPQAVKDEFGKRLREVMGVPDKKEDYGISKPENLPDGVEWDENGLGDYLDIFHKGNVSTATAKQIIEKHVAKVSERAAAQQSQILENGRQELQKVYGDKLPAAIQDAKRGIEIMSSLIGIPAEQIEQQAALNPTMIRMLVEMKRQTSEPAVVTGQGVSGQGSFLEQADAILKDPVQMARFRAGDQGVTEKWQSLMRKHHATTQKAR
jgi:hypothetical protein